MDTNYSGFQDSASQLPTPNIKYHFPYFTPAEVEQLSDKQRGKLSISQEEKLRQQSCGFIEAVGAKIGFPRRTIATAQNLYHRFHLFFLRKDFNDNDISLAALYVSSKMHDTLKKPKEILMVAYVVRFPELAAKSRSIMGEIEMDAATVEHDKQRLLAVERLILETICFNFTSRMPFPYVIKIGRAFGATKKLTKLAWRLTIDSHRTVVNLEYPPHVIALGCLYLAALLSSFEQGTSPDRPGYHSSHQIAATLGKPGQWEQQFQAQIQDLQEIAHAIIDLLIMASQNPYANTSPTTPSSPSPHMPRNQHQPAAVHAQLPPVPYKTDQLIRLKIVMRESEYPPRERESSISNQLHLEKEASLLGRNEGIVRFLFGPPGFADDGV
ncbi:hypothetical protein AcV5_007841 [Taiwanofungus camphoratus]|nr:hypothetical protein AcV5_007841 [Antrodia cinnamomea]KAI0947130.1 hypothetical protein AcV7_009638 [Antrodia cinnamomea]